MISWRNPDARYAKWISTPTGRPSSTPWTRPTRITGSEQTVLAGACSGGIVAAMVAAHLAHTGQQDRIAAFTLMVTVLDQAHAGLASAVIDERTARVAEAASRARGYLDGRSLAEVFAWLRPNDLIWNYWVNNTCSARSRRRSTSCSGTRTPPDDRGPAPGLPPAGRANALVTPGPRPCSAHRWTWPRSTGTATSSPGSPTTSALASCSGPPSCWAADPGSCCRPAGTSPRWSTRRATRRPGTRSPRVPGGPPGVAAPGRDPPRVLVAGLRELAGRALRREPGRPGAGGGGLAPAGDAPGPTSMTIDRVAGPAAAGPVPETPRSRPSGCGS